MLDIAEVAAIVGSAVFLTMTTVQLIQGLRILASLKAEKEKNQLLELKIDGKILTIDVSNSGPVSNSTIKKALETLNHQEHHVA